MARLDLTALALLDHGSRPPFSLLAIADKCRLNYIESRAVPVGASLLTKNCRQFAGYGLHYRQAEIFGEKVADSDRGVCRC